MAVEGGPDDKSLVVQSLSTLAKKVKDADSQKQISNEVKEYHAALSKLGKAIDKVFFSILSQLHRTFSMILRKHTMINGNLIIN